MTYRLFADRYFRCDSPTALLHLLQSLLEQTDYIQRVVNEDQLESCQTQISRFITAFGEEISCAREIARICQGLMSSANPSTLNKKKKDWRSKRGRYGGKYSSQQPFDGNDDDVDHSSNFLPAKWSHNILWGAFKTIPFNNILQIADTCWAQYKQERQQRQAHLTEHSQYKRKTNSADLLDSTLTSSSLATQISSLRQAASTIPKRANMITKQDKLIKDTDSIFSTFDPHINSKHNIFSSRDKQKSQQQQEDDEEEEEHEDSFEDEYEDEYEDDDDNDEDDDDEENGLQVDLQVPSKTRNQESGTHTEQKLEKLTAQQQSSSPASTSNSAIGSAEKTKASHADEDDNDCDDDDEDNEDDEDIIIPASDEEK